MPSPCWAIIKGHDSNGTWCHPVAWIHNLKGTGHLHFGILVRGGLLRPFEYCAQRSAVSTRDIFYFSSYSPKRSIYLIRNVVISYETSSRGPYKALELRWLCWAPLVIATAARRHSPQG
jgi:hypothetical protein